MQGLQGLNQRKKTEETYFSINGDIFFVLSVLYCIVLKCDQECKSKMFATIFYYMNAFFS